MTKQAIGLFLLSGVLAASCGCNVFRAIVYDPFGPNTLCDARRGGLNRGGDACGTACEEPCGPGLLRGRCGLRGAVVAPCDEGGCGECGELPCRCRRGIIRGPLSFVFALFGAGTYRGCGLGEARNGCGERYWGDWYSDPPECSDPCDCHGNFTGGGYSRCEGRGGDAPAGMPSQYDDAGMAPRSGGCRNCGQGGYTSRSSGESRHPAQYSNGNSNATQRYPAPYASGTPRYPAQYSNAAQRYPARYASGSQRYPSQYSSSPYSSGTYAPRLMSTPDRVVRPATAEQAPRLAQPQWAEVREE